MHLFWDLSWAYEYDTGIIQKTEGHVLKMTITDAEFHAQKF